MVPMTWGIPCCLLPPDSTGRQAVKIIRKMLSGRDVDGEIQRPLDENVELYKLTPLLDDERAEHVVVMTPDNSFTMQHLESLLVQREDLRINVERLTEALLHAHADEERGEDEAPSPVGKVDVAREMQAHAEKNLEIFDKRHRGSDGRLPSDIGLDKIHQLHYVNRKLRDETKRLKVRLGNSESTLHETQQTVDNLRKEFMLLIRELLPGTMRRSSDPGAFDPSGAALSG